MHPINPSVPSWFFAPSGDPFLDAIRNDILGLNGTVACFVQGKIDLNTLQNWWKAGRDQLTLDIQNAIDHGKLTPAQVNKLNTILQQFDADYNSIVVAGQKTPPDQAAIDAGYQAIGVDIEWFLENLPRS